MVEMQNSLQYNRLKKQAEIWKAEPSEFCQDIFNDRLFENYTDAGQTYLYDKMIEILNSVRDNRRTAVKSCNSSGKTFIAARIAIWFTLMHRDSIVLTTAPTDRQVEHLLWKEIRVAYNKARMPLGGYMLNKAWKDIAGNPKWYMLGFSVNDYDSQTMQGYHAPDILIIVDEANGIPSVVYEGIESMMTSQNAKLLLIGNPINPQGEFYNVFQSDIGYNRITISAFDTPNIIHQKVMIPGLITHEWIDDVRRKYGDDSAYYTARVLGEFPQSSADALIPRQWVEKSNELWLADENNGILDKDVPTTVICDPGRFGDDPTAIGWRKSNRILKIEKYYGWDTMAITGKLLTEANKGYSIIVDSIGIGSGVVDRLNEQNISVTAHNGAEKSNIRTMQGNRKFKNMRSQIWWQTRETLDPNQNTEDGLLILPPDVELKEDLTTPKYKVLSDGSIEIEPKDKVKARLGRSPDAGDVVTMSMRDSQTELIRWL